MGIEQFIERVCVQTAVYWAAPVNDGYGGQTFDLPIEISCRWEDTTETITSANGEQIVSRANVLVTQDLDDGGYLFLGSLYDVNDLEELDPRKQNKAYKIRRFDKIPMIKKTDQFVRKAFV